MFVSHLVSLPNDVQNSLRARARNATATPGVVSPAVMEMVGWPESKAVTSVSNVLGTVDLYPKAKVHGKTTIRRSPAPRKKTARSSQLSQKSVFVLSTLSVVF